LTDHIHEREASSRLATLIPSQTKPFELAFIPNVAPWFSGIISVLSAPLNKAMRAEEINKLYQEKYANERLVTFSKTVPDVTEAEGKHGWRVGGVQVHSGGKRVVVVVSLPSLSA
jgi:N-acetyl-gamma-glutamyl-phosphate reductase/acetylglutamate kinase